MVMKTYGKLLPGLEIINHRIFDDRRGYFYETYKTNTDSMRGMFRQLNTAKSVKNVLRGMHRQNQTNPIIKIPGNNQQNENGYGQPVTQNRAE